MALRRLLAGLTAVRDGDLSLRLPNAPGVLGEISGVYNDMAERLSRLNAEVTRVAREVGTEGMLGGQAEVPQAVGAWRELADSVNAMAGNLTAQVRNIAQVTTAVARGDLTRTIAVDARGEILELKNTVNTMVEQLSSFAAEVTRVAREVGTEGMLGGQADVRGVSGTWRDLTDSVNFMAGNLTAQVRSIAQVATAVARGDLTRKTDVVARGEILELKSTVNTMVEQLSSFAGEVTRVAREVGTEGMLGGQADVRGVSGTWRDLTDNVNVMASNLTGQVRSIAQVATAVARGDLSRRVTVEAEGEVAELVRTLNAMVDTLSAFAAEVTRVAREVGTDGILGGQARVPNVAGTWKDLTDSVNFMAHNLTSQVRNIAQVTTAVAGGDLTRKIDVDARGEILELKNTVNTMVEQLSSFAAEVTRVAREVGTEGRLGGQAEVEGVSGTWKRLTENVNELAGNLTRQVRAIGEVTSAVTAGDLTRSITVEASGEVADLKDNVNVMVESLRETTRANREQDWLKTHLARLTGLIQGRREPAAVAELLMDELCPLLNAQYGTCYLSEEYLTEDGAARAGAGRPVLVRAAAYGHRASDTPRRFGLGESLIGQAGRSRRPIALTDLPPGYAEIGSALGSGPPRELLIQPITMEDRLLGVVEVATLHHFTDLHRDFLERLAQDIGTTLATLLANARTDELLQESQRLTAELRARSEQLVDGQEELRRSNAELGEKAELLAAQNRDIEAKNLQIEQARRELEDRARQLTSASMYKSEFLANMSHELRTPLNSLLILAQLLAQNSEGNLTDKQVEYAEVIRSAGSDLLQLINDILDLSKVEAGKLDVTVERFPLRELLDYVDTAFRPLAAEKNLDFRIGAAPGAPAELRTDQARLRQILRNLLSNAVKFTDRGFVELTVEPARTGELPGGQRESGAVAFRVQDSGIGIGADHLESIFGAFQQADGTTSRKYGGTGLGLSISRELARLLGGAVSAESVPGEGSCFTLLLPDRLAPAPEATAEPRAGEPRAGEPRAAEPRAGEAAGPPGAAPAAPSPARAGRLAGRTVLVVDDDSRNVYALSTALELEGATALHAANGRTGLAMLRAHPETDLVLMDLMMPELDGYAATAAIRESAEHATLPIIAVTAKAMPDDRARSLAAGADDHLTKPVDTNHLITTVQHRLES
ncbi:HAMP domain-containing protein [Kitasatospora sp. NPDC004614]|uniref:HAMP domain-containing protein n=2 Tax=Kitasatospora TaxID=2063 RepID=UPI0036994BF9